MSIDHRLLAGLLLGAASSVHAGADTGSRAGSLDAAMPAGDAARLPGAALRHVSAHVASAPHRPSRHVDSVQPASLDWADDGAPAGRAGFEGGALGASLPYGFGGLSATPLVMAPPAAATLWGRAGANRSVPAYPIALLDGEWVWRGPKGGFVHKLDDSWRLGVHYTRAPGLVGQDDRAAGSIPNASVRPAFLDARRRALVLNMGHSF